MWNCWKSWVTATIPTKPKTDLLVDAISDFSYIIISLSKALSSTPIVLPTLYSSDIIPTYLSQFVEPRHIPGNQVATYRIYMNFNWSFQNFHMKDAFNYRLDHKIHKSIQNLTSNKIQHQPSAIWKEFFPWSPRSSSFNPRNGAGTADGGFRNGLDQKWFLTASTVAGWRTRGLQDGPRADCLKWS